MRGIEVGLLGLDKRALGGQQAECTSVMATHIRHERRDGGLVLQSIPVDRAEPGMCLELPEPFALWSASYPLGDIALKELARPIISRRSSGSACTTHG